MFQPKTIVITGASSGIGKALAEHYAKPGVTLALTGRNQERLFMVASECRKRGANVETAVMDITNARAVAQWLGMIEKNYGIELLIANAGVSGGTAGGEAESETQTRTIFATNIDGVLNSVLPVIPAMIRKRRGQIALVSSLAAYRGLPGAPSYSASKAAVRAYGEALRGTLKKHRVQVNVICPGYVATPLTAVNNFPMPLLMEPAQAASRIANGLRYNKARIAFPLRLVFPLWVLSCLSPGLTDWFFSRLPSKGNGKPEHPAE
jgi:short-subunit dehydrogenase